MYRIERKLSFFKRNFNVIFGVFWCIFSLSYLLINLTEKNSRTFYWFIGVGYLLIGLGYFYNAFKDGDNRGEYIEWDDERLNYKQNLGKIYSNKLNSLIAITVTKNNLIIKVQNSQGTLASLKGYSEEDLARLRARFGKN